LGGPYGPPPTQIGLNLGAKNYRETWGGGDSNPPVYKFPGPP
jgi:hypothetical protein